MPINEHIDPWEGCLCNAPPYLPPCRFCTSLTEYEAEIYEQWGETGVQNVRMGLPPAVDADEGRDYYDFPGSGGTAAQAQR